ncbi:FxSxx-COOH cyclophane-containing RiPP peptide [Frankia tisae]|uniref:FxSxx-COOH cyclophane-containing RiPP peptide n=1 Tax=Frankia tisae TaxID=2950104 RepID=UPI0021BE57EE|nr:FxSxx-COOH cyclophane-containing RiPP peptide [Frankia tisae]
MIDRDETFDRAETFESVLPDLSDIDLADLADRSNPRLRQALSRLQQEAERPADTMSGFTSSIRPGGSH